MPSFTRESGGTLHVVGVGVNRIGKGTIKYCEFLTVASKKTLNAKNLEALGAQRLAELLIEISTGNASNIGKTPGGQAGLAR